MFTRLTFENFRGIRRLEWDGLRRINLLVGRNNVGKTSVLEGVWLLASGGSPTVALSIGLHRGIRFAGGPPDTIWRSYFYGFGPLVKPSVSGQWEGEARSRRLELEALGYASISPEDLSDPASFGPEATRLSLFVNLRMRYYDPAGFSSACDSTFDPKTGRVSASSDERADFVRTMFLSARAHPSMTKDAEQFSGLLRSKRESEVVAALRLIEPDVSRVEVLAESSGASVYVDLGHSALVPLAMCGEGFVRLFSISLGVVASPGGILLVDEIDNGLHHSVQEKLWNLLAGLCEKHKVQVFATTHNDETVRKAIETLHERPGLLGLFRLRRDGDEHEMVSYDDEAQAGAVEFGFEVRG